MVTKLRKFSTNTGTKLIAFILMVATITAIELQLHYAVYMNFERDCLFTSEYKDSDDFYYKVVNAGYQVQDLLLYKIEIPTNIEYYYYASNGEVVNTNAPITDRSFFEQYETAFYAFENGSWILGDNINTQPTLISNYDDNITIYIAFPDKFMNEKQQAWTDRSEQMMPIIVSILSCIVIFMGLIIFLISVTGRKAKDKELHLVKLDFIYSEVLLFAFIALIGIWYASLSETYMDNRLIYNPTYTVGSKALGLNQKYWMILLGSMTAFFTIFSGVVFLSLIRKLKAGILIKHSIIYTVLQKIKMSCSTLYKYLLDGKMFRGYPLTKTLFYRQLAFIITSAFTVLFALIFAFAKNGLVIFPPMMEVVIIYWYIKGNRLIYEDINKGFNESLEEQMKAERMKVALITNVSHDLKTPLTSIISYVDLLSKEEGLSDTAEDYVNILRDKSDRLKNIVTDLFDLAKSTSGDIALDFEVLDIKKLIEQTLADMSDKIEPAELVIKTKLPDNPVSISADGKKLYRVFQNVIDNALKYSLKGTRVFIELEMAENKAIVTIKNIAGYEMNFTAEDVLQRFNRGDKSRTTEGSGLGLSIAESFTKVCGGDFKVDVDGDMFKVTIIFQQKE